MRALLEGVPGNDPRWNVVDGLGRNMLHYAAASGFVRVALFLINGGTCVTHKDEDGNTPAHLAQSHEREGMVIWLWKKGAKWSIQHDQNKRGEIVFDLLSDRIRQSLRTYQKSLLPLPQTAKAMSVTMDEIANVHEACRAGEVATLRQMLAEHGDDDKAVHELIETRSLEGKNALHHAVENQHVEVVRELCQRGADVDAEEEYRNTPLIIAVNVSCDDPAVVRTLIEYKATVNCVSMFSLVPLLMAVENGYEQVTRCLVEEGEADIHVRGMGGNTALHFAVVNGHLAIASYLLERGADKDLRNDDGKTCVEIASKNLLYLLTDGREGSSEPDLTPQEPRVSDTDYYWDTLLSGHREFRIPYDALQVGDIIGEGNFGNVYGATHTLAEAPAPRDDSAADAGPADERAEQSATAGPRRRIPKRLAVKFLRGNLNGQRRYRELLRLEIQTMVALAHPHVIQFVGASLRSSDNTVCIVTRLAERGSLADILYKDREDIQPGRKVALALDVALGMYYAHRNHCLHRDLRAANVLVDEDWNGLVADWGLACATTATCNFHPKLEVVGSLHWMAPEVFRKACRVEKSDVYSYGMTLYELLTMQPPFVGMSPLDAARAAAGQTADSPARPEFPVPPTCRDTTLLYDLVADCWQDSARKRPCFLQLVLRLAAHSGRDISQVVPQADIDALAAKEKEQAAEDARPSTFDRPPASLSVTRSNSRTLGGRRRLPKTAMPGTPAAAIAAPPKSMKFSASGLPVTCRPPTRTKAPGKHSS